MGNVAHLHGFVAKPKFPIEIRQSNGGAYYIGFSVVTSRKSVLRDGTPKTARTYHRVVVYGMESYLENHILPRLNMDSRVYITGEIRNSSFTGDHGQLVRMSEIVINRNFGSIEFSDCEEQRSEHVS